MKRPLPRASAIWLGIIGGAAALDYWADRGEPDADTISECCRTLVGRLPAGRYVFTVACVAVPWWFHGHILSGLAGRIEAIGDPRELAGSGGLTNT